MDKNTIAGLVIIFLILIGFSYFTRPSKEQVAEMQRKQDSIARVDRLRAQELAAQQQAQKTPANTTAANPLATKSDSIFVQNDTENKIITLENDKIKLHISTLGGRIVYVDLKEYRTRFAAFGVVEKRRNRFRHEFLCPESGDQYREIFLYTQYDRNDALCPGE